MKNKIVLVLAIPLLLYISSMALASWVYPPDKQGIYEVAYKEERECFDSLSLNPDKLGDCISKRLSRIDKQINLAYWKSDRLNNISFVMEDGILPEGVTKWEEQERLNNEVKKLQQQRKDLLDRNTIDDESFTKPQ